MAADFVINQFATRNVSTESRADSASQVGRLSGLQVREAPTAQSLLSDAAEELTFSVDNTEELELKERPQKESAKDEGLLEKVKLYRELMWSQRSLKDKLGALRRFLETNRDPGAALQKAREHFPDPTQAWAALKSIQEEMEREGAPPEVRRAVEEALATLEAEDGPRIRAGLEGALAGAAYPGLGSPLDLGESYRQVSCDFRGPVDMLEHVLEKFGPDRFEEAMDFLSKSLASDLGSAGDGPEKAHLETVGRGLGQVRILKSAHALSERLLDRWSRVHGVAGGDLTPMDVLREVMSMGRESYLPQSRLEALAGRARPPDLEREVLFLQEFLSTARSFSPQLFEGPENRMKFIAALQETVDAAIAREDAYLASLEE